ncbi:MAG: ABC transporter permease [Tannerella sp.]|jgi:putative ABC transport system permease protein|nr:ABC transporter permease [Tannerella sp.]
MPSTFKNLIFVLKRFKLATTTNLLGLSLSFFLFMLICIHVTHEYGFDSAIANKDRIFQLENLRDDGIWESNFSRPQLERFITASPFIEAAGITNNLVHSSFRFGISAGSGPDSQTYMERLERITPDFTKVFDFEMISGSTDCLKQPDKVLISESMAKKLFGETDPVDKPVYFNEFRGSDSFTMYGLNFKDAYVVGGVYRDFPENTRLKNALYTPIIENEMMDDWFTGPYYCYLLVSSPETAATSVEEYATENKEFLAGFSIDDIRVRPLTELYFGKQVRADAAPTGNKLRTNMLLFVAILIIGIALVNYINLSVALAPIRTKSITTQKVLGCPQNVLRKYLVFESVGISILAFFVALVFIVLLQNTQLVTGMLGHPVNLYANSMIVVWTFLLVIGAGLLAGIYPAFYITSFPPAMALNGSFSLSNKAKNTRKLLIGFQFVISITLIIGSLFVYMQNKYLGNINLGYNKENVLEVRLSMGTGLSKSHLFQTRLLEHPDIKDVAFNEFKFVSDESRSSIGYNYRNQHYYMSWLGVSPNFPQLMDFELIAGRDFRTSDEAPDNTRAVCMINETAAREIISRFTSEDIEDISELVGTSINENNIPVQIVGIFKDVHYESLYKEIRPLGIWVSAKNQYRRVLPENYSYVKIAGGNPQAAINHIQNVINELNPGYPADIRFFDKALDELYNKSHQQGLLVTLLCLMAVILSLVGVFGLVIFESQGREKEIAVRKVFGATIEQILWMFNSSFLRIVAVGFIISAPIAYYGVNQWLQGFAYKTPLYLWVFLVALIAITMLTILTVTIQSYRVATANPAPKL